MLRVPSDLVDHDTHRSTRKLSIWLPTGGSLSVLRDLQSARDLEDLATLLGYSKKGVAYILYKQSDAQKYRKFFIPKKAGGVREICAPRRRLKKLQRKLADLLCECVSEIEESEPHRQRLAHGYYRGRNIVSNAKPHRSRRYVLNVDIEDYFGSINFGRVRGILIADKRFQLRPEVATVIAQIACHDNRLPQGSPASPVVSNIVGRLIDVRFAKVAKRHGCTYTRYVDDITFSTGRLDFPRRLARQRMCARSTWKIGRELRDEFKRLDFRVSESKTRMQLRTARQDVTGLVVNQKVNVAQEYSRSVRHMCHSLFKNGFYYIPWSSSEFHGPPAPVTSLAPLGGRLGHVWYIKARQDRDDKINKAAGHQPPKKTFELYRDFLRFKYFVAAQSPVIVTEGKSDVSYIRSAIKVFHPKYTRLSAVVDGELEILPNFLRPSKVNQALLNLGDGTGGMSQLICGYKNMMERFEYCPMSAPVLLVVDNDKGGKPVLKEGRKLSASGPAPGIGMSWMHVCLNLYLVWTPKVGKKPESRMEDLFSASLLGKTVAGKKFDPDKPHGDHSSISKAVFADKIVAAARDPLDFPGFPPLLASIEAAITHHTP